MVPDERKDALREAVLTTRAGLSPAAWAAEDASRTRHALELLTGSRARPDRPGTVALYAARPGEPGTAELISTLAEQGWRVLLPVLRRVVDWAEFDGDLTIGWAGIPQPPGPRLGAEALALADVVVVPCLAVGRDWTRLGTGGGWYDRALAHRRPGTPVVALARAAEIFDTVPTLAHDVSIDAFVTEDGSAAR